MENETQDVNGLTVEEKLERAAAASSPKATVEDTTNVAADTEDNRVPYKRFAEVNSALKEVRASESEAREALLASQDRLVKMAELLQAKEDDVRTLNEIKSYVNDPIMKDHVLAIDARLKGIELEVKTGETTPTDGLAKAQALIEKTRDEVLDTKADLQADALIQKADSIADKLLASLPKEYNEQDRSIISDLFTEKVNWDAAVANPDQLSAILTQGFQATIDRYGVPRGAMFSTDEVKEFMPDPADAPMTPEQELEAILGMEWGKTVDVETKGGTKPMPELSDEAFSDAMAHIIRRANSR